MSEQIAVNCTEPTTAAPSVVTVHIGTMLLSLPPEGARELGTKLIGYSYLSDMINGSLAPADDGPPASGLIVPGF
jgi:hypothetical protein